ncbi:MAG: hypothetical protein ACKVX9_02315 [Blastocatellia bacterium]
MAMNRGRAKRAGVLLGMIGLAGGVLAAGFLLLPRWLVIDSQMEDAEVIFHLAIDTHSNADPFIAGLYRPGKTRKIVCVSGQISWEEYPADYAARHLIELGVPAESVSAMRMPVLECRAEALRELAARTRAEGARRVLLVAQPEDSRHLYSLARTIFAREGLEAFVAYAPEDRDELLRDWWRVHWKVQRFVDEAMQISLDSLYSNCR